MKQIPLILISLFLALAMVSLYSGCNEIQGSSVSPAKVEHDLLLSLKADEFLSLDDGEQFTGFVLDYDETGLTFQKVTTSEDKLVKMGSVEHLDFKRLQLTTDGNFVPINNDFSVKEFQYWKETFEFTYFSWEVIERLASQSEYLYLSGAEVVYGMSIHNPFETLSDNPSFFSLKIEGDHKNMDAVSTSDDRSQPNPVTVIGVTCKSYWRIF